MFFITGKSQTAKGKYNQNNSIKFEKESIKSSLFGYSGAFILVTWDIMVTADKNTDVAFKTSAPFSACKAEIHDMFIAETNYLQLD